MSEEDSKFFCDDIVLRRFPDKRIIFGVIDDTSNSLENDHICVTWFLSHKTQSIHQNKLLLYDRFLTKGEIVKLESGSSQLGYCLDVNHKVSIRVMNTDKVIPNVDVCDLLSTMDFCVGEIVMYERWIGKVKNVDREIVVETHDHSKFILDDDELFKLFKIFETPKIGLLEQGDPFVGQVLVGNNSLFVNARKGKMSNYVKQKLKEKNGTLIVQIEAINVCAVEIQCLCEVSDRLEDNKPSSLLITKRELSKLAKLDNHPIVDKYHKVVTRYRIKEGDTIQNLTEWNAHVTAMWPLKPISHGVKIVQSKSDNDEVVNQITYDPDMVCDKVSESVLEDDEMANLKSRCTMIDSLKIDGAEKKMCKSDPKEEEEESVSLIEAQKNIEIQKCISEVAGTSKKPRSTKNLIINKMPFNVAVQPGELLSVEVILCNTIADVIWQDRTIDKDVISCQLVPLNRIERTQYFPGDFVKEDSATSIANIYGCVKSANHIDRTVLVTWVRYSPTETGQSKIDIVKEENCSAYSITRHTDFKFQRGAVVVRINDKEKHNRSAKAGKVLEIQFTGHLRVKWVNGKEEIMCPQDLHYVGTSILTGDYDSETSTEIDSWESLSDSSILSVNGIHSLTYDDFITSGTAIFDEVDYRIPPLKVIVKNPIFEFRQIIHHFSKTPSIQNASVIFKLFQCGIYCKNFRKLLLQSLKMYADRSVGEWEKFLTDLTKVDKKKAEIIYKNLCDSSGLHSDLSDGINLELEDMLNDHDAGFKLKNDGIRNFRNILKDLVLSEEFCGKEYIPPPNLFGCHKLCASFDYNFHKYDDETCSDENSAIEDKNLLTFLDSVKVQLKEIFIPKSKLKMSSYPVAIETYDSKVFTLMNTVPEGHHYRNVFLRHSPNFPKFIQQEFMILKNSLPSGIHIKAFMDQLDLFSVMIEGPKNTPYDDALFLFDLQLPEVYPYSPPNVFYIAFCADRLNPNLYEDGKVCLSLLGTWEGKGTEIWIPSKSNLYQLLVSIQSLVLVSEPYYNEAGYKKLNESYQDDKNSRRYNQMAVLKTIDSMVAMIKRPTAIFKKEILQHFKTVGPAVVKRYKGYALLSEDEKPPETLQDPGFPLLPGTNGFYTALKKCIEAFEKAIDGIEGGC